MKIAIVGTGISGMVAAYLLAPEHEITVFEAGSYIGGHTHTVPVEIGGRTYAVDTGFIVFNERTYPNFTRLLNGLGVASQDSTMSFSVRCERTGLEYCGASLGGLFAQRRNLLRPGFYRMLRDIVRFNRESRALLDPGEPDVNLADYLRRNRYSREFQEHYLVPLAAAIWSANPASMARFPARYFVRFCDNHGLLGLRDRPQWRVIRGGSWRYVEALTEPFRDRIRLNTPIASVRRYRGHVSVTPRGGTAQRFDHVVLATHADSALALLADPSPVEREVLSAFPFQRNDAVLHTDSALLPRRRRAWASWNYHAVPDHAGRVAVTYHMNQLQSLAAPCELLVTLNHTGGIDPSRVLRRMTYHHPVYTQATVAAQRRHGEISGRNRTSYCGAYWGYGFHEDGVNSALAVARKFGRNLASCTVASTKVECGTVASSR